jgi:hypothetical protein
MVGRARFGLATPAMSRLLNDGLAAAPVPAVPAAANGSKDSRG